MESIGKREHQEKKFEKMDCERYLNCTRKGKKKKLEKHLCAEDTKTDKKTIAALAEPIDSLDLPTKCTGGGKNGT